MPQLPSVSPIPPQPGGQQNPLPAAFAMLSAFSSSVRRIGDDAALTVAGTSFPVIQTLTGKGLLFIGRVQGSAGAINFGPRFNGDATNNYGVFNLFSSGAGAADGAAGVASFIQGGQATNATSAAWACFVPGHRLSGLTNNPTVSISASSVIVLVRSAWWNQGVPIDTVQVVADGNMAPGSVVSVYELL